MKRIVLIICMLTALLPAFAQKNKKQSTPANQNIPDKAQLNKMMESMMNQQGLTAEQKAQIKQLMKNGVPDVPGAKAGGSTTKIPALQSARLAHIPKLANAAACENYIQKLKAKASLKIPAATRQRVDALIAKYQGNKAALIDLGPALLLRKSVVAAVYAAIQTEQANSGNNTVKNNLAVILHQAGYPQHALPILDYLNMQKPGNANTLNNIGQCYLSLGDKQKAKTWFMGALRIDANNAQANCGTAFILANEGLISDAIPYIQKAMKNGYSEVLDDMVEQKGIKLDFNAMKPMVPEYFNPQKYKPVPSATKLKDIGPVNTQKLEIEALAQSWDDKTQKFSDERDAKIKTEGPSQWGARIYGFTPKAPFARRAKFMFIHAMESSAAWQVSTLKDVTDAQNRANELHRKLINDIDAALKNRKFESTYADCEIQKKIVEQYLTASAAVHDGIIRKTLHQRYDYVNEQLHWARFLLNANEYNSLYYSLANWLMRNLAEYNKYQVLTQPERFMISCEKLLQNPPKKQVAEDDPDGECPIKIGIPLGAASIKSDCESFSIEGGEIAVFGIDKNFRNGELTFSFGLGGELDVMGLSPGAKGQFFFTVGNDYMPVDCGMKFDAGVDTNVGPIVIENNVTATIGLTSGINVEATKNGDSFNIFTLNPAD